MISALWDNVRRNAPLVHNITNYVTVNDCANILLACGASPIMADDAGEAAEITSICGGLNINIGTLNVRTIESMELAGKRANELSHPVLLDPVGAGASKLRTQTALDLLERIKFSVVRGNMSEIKTIVNGSGFTHGVDVSAADAVTESNIAECADFIKNAAKSLGCVVAVSGAIDLVSDGDTVYAVRNGCALMGRITGSGCMLSALTAACIAANPDDIFHAVLTAVCAMGAAGEAAQSRMTAMDGNAGFRTYLIDAIYNMNGAKLETMAKYECV